MANRKALEAGALIDNWVLVEKKGAGGNFQEDKPDIRIPSQVEFESGGPLVVKRPGSQFQ